MSVVSSNQSLTQAAQQAAAAALAAANNAANNAASASSTSGTTTAGSALAQLGANFNQFLQLLLTQVQNQDPTDPTNTDQFTTELVQFTGVQEQVNANTSLGQLINLQQSSQVLQTAGLVGKQATVSSNEITLQNGSGEVSFTGTAGQPVAISIVDANGNDLRDATVTATAGTNTWTWDGTDNNGNAVPDGAYGIAVETQAGNSAPTAVPFSVIGTTTGVSTSGTTTQLQLGGLNVPLSALQGINAN
jgi:flagellar basal-body rod modification protein FlgD